MVTGSVAAEISWGELIARRDELAPAQEAIWLHQQRHPASTAYNLTVGIRISGRADADTVRAALQGVIDRHDPLRSVYAEVGGRGRRFVLAEMALDMRTVTLDPFPAMGTEAAEDSRVTAAIGEIARRPYRLEREALRATLLTDGGERHLLLVGLHHLTADGWSAGRFVTEGVANFQRLTAGKGLATDPPRRSYAEWATGERARLAGGEGAATAGYWGGALAGAEPLSRVPATIYAPEPSFAGARVEVAVPAALRDRLRALAHEQGASMFTAILAGTQAVLARLAGQTDVVVAVPHANRTEETEETIGLFASTLPIRARVGAGATFRTLVDAVGASLRGARQHGSLPFDRIVKAADLTSVGAEGALCQVMVNYLGHAVPPIALGEMEFEYLGTYDTGEAQYELSIHLEDTADSMRGFVEYRTDRYDEDGVRRFWQRLLSHLEAVSASPDTPLAEVPILSERDLIELRGFERGEERDFELGLPLDEHVARQVRRTPDAIALSDSNDRLSYRETWDRARGLGEVLRRRGVSRGDVVLVCAERSVRLPVALLAIMRIGAIYCPLDPEQPPARLRHVVDQAAPAAVVADPHLLPLAVDLLGADASIPLMALDPEGWSCPTDAPTAADVVRDSRPRDPAYLIFTSGSTGRPKGVLVPHDGVVNRLLWMQRHFGLSPADTVLQKTPYTFDVSVWELFWPLIVGARLHLADPGSHRDPEHLAETIRAERVTTVHFVPTMLAAFVQGPDAAGCSSLRRVICSGEALSGALMNEALGTFAAATLWNLYGPTEASIDVTCWRCRPQPAGSPVPIGAPIDNVLCAVLDGRMRRVPVGTPGELYLGGVQVALGYVGQAELTAERFVESEIAPGRLYRTGDLVRWRPDGLLEYLGRTDGQVKLRGVRIELGEIEEVLREMADVADAAVTVRSDAGPSEALVAYVVPAGAAPGEDELRARLARLLPSYMVPLRVLAVERLPSTDSGKVDRRALPRPTPRSAPAGRELSADERRLAELWTEVLDIGESLPVGAEDSYFALGGDSMTSVRLRAAARNAGFDLSLRDILSRPVLADMATALSPCAAEAEGVGQIVLPGPAELPPGVEDAYPLSAMQAGMIFHSEFSETSSSYQVTFDLELRLPWAPAAFQDAVDELVERHEILRTSFDLHTYREPMQLVHERVRLPVRFVELDGRSVAQRQLECDRTFDAEQVRRFDLAVPPALRLSLIRTGEEVAHLFMAFHDAVFDGWSGAVFLTELCSRYLAGLDGGALPRQRLGTRYRDFVALERDAREDRAGLEHWLGVCADAPFARMPRRERVVGGGRSRDVGLDVPGELVGRLRALADERMVPLKALLVTAYMAAVGRSSGERDLLAGLVSGGRPETADSDGMLGQFLNTVPIRARLEGAWSALLERVHRNELEGLPFRRVPLLELIRRRGGRAPFETAFNLVHFHVYGRLAAEQRVELLSGRFTDPFHFPLTVNARLHPLDGSLAIVVNYNESEVDPASAERLAADMVDALEAIAATPEAPCDEWLGAPTRPPGGSAAATVPAPQRIRVAADPGDGPTDTEVARVLSKLWESVLEVHRAEPDQDFFAVGGDSILTVQLAARARADGLALRPRDVFECGTLGALIRRVEAGPESRGDREGQILEAPVADPGIVAMAARRQGGYDCAAVCFELRSELDGEAAMAAAEAVFRRHQLLRSIAVEEGPGRWVRRVLEPEACAPPFALSARREASGWLRELLEAIDGERGPAARIGYLRSGEGRAFVALVADHGAADLASLQLAGGDFLDAYAQHAAIGEISLDPAPGLAALDLVGRRGYDCDRGDRSTPAPWRPSAAALGGLDRVETVAIGVRRTAALWRSASAAGVGVQHLVLVAAARALSACDDPAPGSPVVLDLMDAGRATVGVEAELVAPLAHPVPVSIADPTATPVASARELGEDLADRGGGASRVRELADLAIEEEPEAEPPGVLVNHLGRVDPELPWPLKQAVAPAVPLRAAPRRASHAIEVRSRITAGALAVEVASPETATGAEQLLAFAGALHGTLAEIAAEEVETATESPTRDPVGGPR